MKPNSYTINQRPLSLYSTLENELQFEATKNYLFDLSYLGLVQVEGDNSKSFLQGQLTCDVANIQPDHMKPGALCNLKGRILALMDVLQWHGVKLVLPKDMIDLTLSDLAKTAMFSRVKLSEQPIKKILGFYCQNSEDLMPSMIEVPETLHQVKQTEGYCIYRISSKLHIILLDHQDIDPIKEPFITNKQWKGSLAWHKLQLLDHLYELYPESTGVFLPHRLGLHNTERISFNKGCYRGQEIIARTHYRAKLKHEMRLYIIKSQEALHVGQPLFSTDEPRLEIGELVDYCPIGNDQTMIAASVLIENDSPQCYIGDHLQAVKLVPIQARANA
ncbi:CAF17-like 4Fe-4S cluster assembly/insertion protein YgfZ [Legionella impletisoli]|uniref:Glycine cleavage system protein T n=1 Tax=Legionella impletisoli TaxID=343510 RepID=A0A917JML4_9GAMM|nr:folate-binding protein YgfZ [Legionella impletisoli]GGI77010.1 glycine cleavage system protein T [Legionella impletisoli]